MRRHRERVRISHHVNKCRAGMLKRLLKPGTYIGGVLDPNTQDANGFGKFCEVLDS
jgi:hypothetical protein